MRVRKTIGRGMVLLAGVIIAGCGSSPATSSSGGSTSTAMDDGQPPDPAALRFGPEWPLWPVDMRIHPLSRLLMVDGRVMIEARLEFVDRDGISTRAVGDVWFELHDATGRRRVGDRTRWKESLTPPDKGLGAYDPIVRTYRFLLDTDWTAMPKEPWLHADFHGADETLKRVRAPLRTK